MLTLAPQFHSNIIDKEYIKEIPLITKQISMRILAINLHKMCYIHAYIVDKEQRRQTSETNRLPICIICISKQLSVLFFVCFNTDNMKIDCALG